MNHTAQLRPATQSAGSAAPHRDSVAKQLGWLRRYCSPWMTKKQKPAPAAAPVARLLEASAFAALAERQLRQSLHRKLPLSLAVFEFSELDRVSELHGRQARQALMDKVLASLAAVAGTGGAVALSAPGQYAALLPGLDRQRALRAIRRVMGHPARVQVVAGGVEIVLMPEFEVECPGNHYESMAALHRELCRDLKNEGQHRHDQRKQTPTEAEPPARKSVLVWPDDPAVEQAFLVRAPFPATVPMELTQLPCAAAC